MEVIREEDLNANLTVYDANSEVERLNINLQIESNLTEYYSVKSDFPSQMDFLDEDEIRLKTRRQSHVERKDSFDSLLSETGYELESEYEMMKMHLMNNDFAAVRELDRKIVQKETAKRRLENKNRLDKLKKLESSLATEKRMVGGFIEPNENKKLDEIKRKYTLQQDEIKPDELFLVNVNKGEGYSILNAREFEEHFAEQKFFNYLFYVKK